MKNRDVGTFVFQDGEGDEGHLPRDVADGDGMVFSALALAVVNAFEERVLAHVDGDLGSLHEGGAEVFASALGHFAFAFERAAFMKSGVEAGGGDEFVAAVFEFGMEDGERFAEDGRRPDGSDPGDRSEQ